MDLIFSDIPLRLSEDWMIIEEYVQALYEAVIFAAQEEKVLISVQPIFHFEAQLGTP